MPYVRYDHCISDFVGYAVKLHAVLPVWYMVRFLVDKMTAFTQTSAFHLLFNDLIKDTDKRR